MVNNVPGAVGRPTISGGSLSYTQQGFADINDPFSTQITVFTAPVATGASMTITVDDNDNDSIYGWSVQVLAYTDYDTSTPITGEVDSGTADIADGSHTLTLSAAPTSADVSLYWLYLDVSNQPGLPTMDTGWTKVFDSGVASGGGTLVTARRESSTSTAVTCTDVYTAGGSFFKASMIALNVQAAAAAGDTTVKLRSQYLDFDFSR